MKKIAILFTILSIFIISGCGNNEEFDFQGNVLEIVDTTSIVVGEGKGDPTATYPAYTILVTENTSFSGDVKKISDLKVGQSVQISIEGDKAIDKVEGDITATEISAD
ncbi:hypothetical protein [Bacillus weihaiensis]|uniref:hypothetical protein n=1 Tax=Bacillus weihaiensis TaxID=1547283 RepID=UPI002354B972|nr:hypothetical protein [Bacillus weihaiensis]